MLFRSCVGLAQHLFGSEENFVAKMNEKAAELGMDSTHFVTCTGLHDENHYTTVRDLTKLLSYALQNDTFRQITAPQNIRQVLQHPHRKVCIF